MLTNKRGAPPYVALATYHEREAFYITTPIGVYITRRKALYHVALAYLVRQTTDSTCPVRGNKSKGITSSPT